MSALSKYRSPTELRIQWMRLEGVYTEAEILASIENGEVESLEQEQIHFNSMLQLTCIRHGDYIKSKIDRIFENEIDSLRLYA
jgi:hypothetical protein